MSNHRSRSSRALFEELIPGGGVTEETRRQLDVTEVVIQRDAAGAPTIVRQRSRHKLERLLEEGALTVDEVAAALRLKALADNAHAGLTVHLDERVDGGSRSADTGIVGRLDRERIVAEVLSSLPSDLRAVAEAYVLERAGPATLTALGGRYVPRLNASAKRAAGKALVVATCRGIAEYFERRSMPFGTNPS